MGSIALNKRISVTLEKWISTSKHNAIKSNNETTLSKVTAKHASDFVMSPFRFPGSKGRAIKYIRPFWERINHDEYREPLFGGGAVFFAKPKVKFNWINDIDRELIITLKVMADPVAREQLIQRVTSEVATKERFEEIKAWKPTSDIEIAHRFFYINRTSYCGIMKQPPWGYHPKKSVPPLKWGDRIRKAGEKLEGVKITQYDFSEVITAPPTGKTVFLFIDPPYYHSDQKRAYTHSFSIKDHYRLCKLLQNTSYYFCLTYDDCPEIRNMYSWANIHPVSWRYHTANSRKAKRKMGRELIITNY
jgi:DNA adenine methylase